MKSRVLFLTALFALASVAVCSAATNVNDGTTVSGLTRLANAPADAETSFLSVETNGTLRAVARVNGLSSPIYTTWYAEALVPTGGVYSVSADFKPASTSDLLRSGGVAGWVATGRSCLVLQILPSGAASRFQVARVDFQAGFDSLELTGTNLFLLDGTPVLDSPSGALAAAGAAFVPTNPATYELTFSAPTPADQTALPGVTAHLIGRVWQGSDASRTEVCQAIELLTDLPLPAANEHRFGYFAAYTDYPVAFDFTNIPIGTLDNLTVNGQIGIGNQPPSVQLVAPQNNASFPEHANVALSVSATDPDGTVARVDYYLDGSTLIASSTNAPFQATWQNAAAGSHQITAVAFDAQGASGASSAVTVAILANQAPTVQLVAPQTGAKVVEQAALTLSAEAADADGFVARVDFQLDGTTIASVATSPFTASWTSAGVGTHQIIAIAFDNLGASSASTAATIEVAANQAPTVELTSPLTNTTVTAQSTVPLTVQVNDKDGAVVRVEYYLDGATLIATSTNAPFSASWVSTTGAHQIVAVVFDDLGATGVSGSVAIQVLPNQPPTVQLTSPANNATVNAQSAVPLTVQVNDPDGSVVRVDYYLDGATLIASSTTAPFDATWASATAGTHQIVALALDNQGASGASAAVVINVSGGTAPRLTITRSGASITLSWTQAGYILQYADSLGGSWTPITTTGQQHTEQASLAHRFYRLVSGGSPAAPTLSLTRSATNITLTWDQPGYTLQSTSALGGSWQPVTTSGQQFSEAITATNRFFRLIK